MAKLRTEQYIVGPVMTNCYLAVNEETKEALVIDPGDEAARLIQKIRERNVTPAAVLLTHGHFDHAGAARELADAFGILIYAHEKEKKTLEMPGINLSGMTGEPPASYHADVFVKDGDVLDLAGFSVRVLFTPGHTEGSICFFCGDALFSGDTLFQGSCGRTDLQTGDWGQMMESLKRLRDLPGEYNVFPGHGPATTLAEERRSNPYM